MRQSILNMPSEQDIMAALDASGWRLANKVPYSIQEDLQDCFLYIGKHQPRRYFDPQIRNGISSFRMEEFQTEVNQNLVQLDIDIQSGKVAEVIDSYAHDDGDYCFLVFQQA